MLASGYEGTREITKHLRNTVGWSATAGEVENFVCEDANDVFIKDPEVQRPYMKRHIRKNGHRRAGARSWLPDTHTNLYIWTCSHRTINISFFIRELFLNPINKKQKKTKNKNFNTKVAFEHIDATIAIRHHTVGDRST